MKFKRHFRTLKTVIARKSDIKILVAWTNFLTLRQEEQPVRLRKPLIYLSIYLSSHNLSLIGKKLTNVTIHFSVVDSPVLVKIGVRFPPLNEEQCNQLKELWWCQFCIIKSTINHYNNTFRWRTSMPSCLLFSHPPPPFRAIYQSNCCETNNM